MTKHKRKHKDKRVRMFEGLPVIDADSAVSVTITPADVKAAKKKDAGACAAALAGKREFHREVKVFLSRMYVKDPKKQRWTRYVTPSNVGREIISFDRGSEFTPGEYEFKAPTPGQRLGYHINRKHHDETGPRLRKKNHVVGNVRISARESWR